MAKYGFVVAIIALLVTSIALEQLASKCVAVSISCGSVTSKLVPCLNFITDKASEPSNGCCVGAKQVAEMALTVVDRQATCECIKNALKNVANVDYDHITDIPKDCSLSVTLPPIQSDTNCSSIEMSNLLGY